MFITGTDTGVGKTIITLALAKALRQDGLDVGVMKPISCGPAAENDALFLKKLLKIDDPLELINPIKFKEPLAPYAILRKPRSPSVPRASGSRDSFAGFRKTIFQAYKELKKRHDVVLVEGAGGVMVPITKDYFVVDMIKEFDLPTIIVARAGLGTLNHTLLTIMKLRDYKIDIKGVILNGYKGDDLSEKSNADIIEELGKVKILAKVKDYKRKR
ncbi:MAG: dethiobiotin synthase [Candidatus Margulisiibacteriota bacterium]